MRLIGLTGGISTGKSTVARYLGNTYLFPVWDADVYAREAVQADSPLLSRIVSRYGNYILLPDGNLDRERLGQIVFANPKERTWLEQQIHPFVRDRFVKNIEALPNPSHLTSPTAVLVIPLLFEAKMTDLVTEIWVVYCSPEQQKIRLLKRNPNLTLTEAEARINSQMSLDLKCEKADIILDNSSTLEALFQQVDQAFLLTVDG